MTHWRTPSFAQNPAFSQRTQAGLANYITKGRKTVNRALLNKQISKDFIDDLKTDTKILFLFLHNQNDGAIIHVLEKIGKIGERIQ